MDEIPEQKDPFGTLELMDSNDFVHEFKSLRSIIGTGILSIIGFFLIRLISDDES